MSAKFLTELNVTELTDTGDSLWKVDTPFIYQSDLLGTLNVPVGFVTDFASVPRIGWIYALVGDTAHEPAVIHDYLYFTGQVARSLADKVLFEAMGAIGMPWWRRYPIYLGVRVGGWEAWNEHRKRDPQPVTKAS